MANPELRMQTDRLNTEQTWRLEKTIYIAPAEYTKQTLSNPLALSLQVMHGLVAWILRGVQAFHTDSPLLPVVVAAVHTIK